MQKMFRAHPWHGVSIGPDFPMIVPVYIEIVPTDVIKYEVDKETGILSIDRPQRYSSLCPSLYGFIPRTYCGSRVGQRCAEVTGSPGVRGDGDPMDICVLTERPITHGDILLQAIPIGGIRMVDKDEADDKIIAVLKGDPAYGSWRDIAECPAPLIERLQHYFLTYKDIPMNEAGRDQARIVRIAEVYGADEAQRTIALSQEDYVESYGAES